MHATVLFLFVAFLAMTFMPSVMARKKLRHSLRSRAFDEDVEDFQVDVDKDMAEENLIDYATTWALTAAACMRNCRQTRSLNECATIYCNPCRGGNTSIMCM